MCFVKCYTSIRIILQKLLLQAAITTGALAPASSFGRSSFEEKVWLASIARKNTCNSPKILFSKRCTNHVEDDTNHQATTWTYRDLLTISQIVDSNLESIATWAREVIDLQGRVEGHIFDFDFIIDILRHIEAQIYSALTGCNCDVVSMTASLL